MDFTKSKQILPNMETSLIYTIKRDMYSVHGYSQTYTLIFYPVYFSILAPSKTNSKVGKVLVNICIEK